APYSVLEFSSGSGGIETVPTYLMTHLASDGFVVIAPSHIGSRAERVHDLTDVLDDASGQIPPDDAVLTGLLDTGRVGITGWSLGGDSALRAIDQDHRFRAVLAMAPGGDGPPRLDQAVSDIGAPTM